DIKKLVVKIQADLKARVKAHLDVVIPKLALNLGPIAKVDIKASVDLKADIQARLKAFVEVCVKLLADAKLVADIGAL
ncbi:hypothetical protein BGZ94_005360, partial [Podila epigama]